MNGKGNIITSLIVLAAGILLCVLSNRPNVLHTIIFVTGVMFIVPALVNIVLLFGRGNADERPSYSMRVMGWISSIAGIILGVCLVLSPDFFLPILVYLFGAVLVAGALFQIYMVGRGYRPVKLPGVLYVAPVIVLIGGVVMLFTGHYGEDGVGLNDQTVSLMTGIGMILFGVNAFATMIVLHNIKRGQKAIAEHSESAAK